MGHLTSSSGLSDGWEVSGLGGEAQQQIGASQDRKPDPGRCVRTKNQMWESGYFSDETDRNF